jgi:hypothetical protein
MIVIIVAIAIVAVAVAVTASRNNDTEQVVTDSTEQNVVEGATTALYKDPVMSNQELADFIADTKVENANVIILNPGQVDFNNTKLIPVAFYLSSGKSTQQVSYNGPGAAPTVNVLRPAQACIYPTVQVEHIVFLEVPADEKVESGNSIEVVLLPNDARCEF